MKAFQAQLAKLAGADTQVLGVSVDSPFSNHGQAIKAYGLEKTIDVGGVKVMTARRATFLIDKEGKVIETSVDREAVDPTKIVDACEYHAKKKT